jgi:hypothetical protein
MPESGLRYLRSIDRTRRAGEAGAPRVVFRPSEGGWREGSSEQRSFDGRPQRGTT